MFKENSFDALIIQWFSYSYDKPFETIAYRELHQCAASCYMEHTKNTVAFILARKKQEPWNLSDAFSPQLIFCPLNFWYKSNGMSFQE